MWLDSDAPMLGVNRADDADHTSNDEKCLPMLDRADLTTGGKQNGRSKDEHRPLAVASVHSAKLHALFFGFGTPADDHNAAPDK